MELVARISGVSVLLKKAWGIFKAKSSVIVPIASVSALITIIFSYIGQTQFKPDAEIGIVFLLIFVAGIVLAIASQIALISVIGGHSHSVATAYKKGFSLTLPYLWVSLLSGIAILGGLAAFVIPLFIVAVFLSFTSFTVIAEDLRGLKALSQSSWYVSGYWAAVAGRLLILILLSIVVFGISSIFTGPNTFATDVIHAIVGIVIIPVLTAYMYEMYKDLKHIKSTGPHHASALTPRAIKGFITLGILAFFAFIYIAMTFGERLLNDLKKEGFEFDESSFDEKAFEKAIRDAVEKQRQLRQ